MIDQQLKRLAEFYETGDNTSDVYGSKKVDLLMERDRLEVAPVTASLANQRHRIQAIVDDWPEMTGGERERMLALIFMEIRANHAAGKRLLVTFKSWLHWEPYVDAVLARKAATESAGDPVSTSERRTGLEPADRTRSHAATPRRRAGPAAPRCVTG